MAVQRPNGLVLTAQDKRTEINLLADLRTAVRFKDVYPKRLVEAEENLAEFYQIVLASRRK